MTSWIPILAASFVVGAPAPSLSAGDAAAHEPQTLLLLDPRVVDRAQEDTTELVTALRSAAGALAGLHVSSMADVRERLSKAQLATLDACDGGMTCLDDAARAVNAELALTSSLGRVGGRWLLVVTLIDVVHARPLADETETAADMKELLPKIPALLQALRAEGLASDAPTVRLTPGTKLSLAAFDLAATGVAPAVAENLTQVLTAELRSLEGVSVISRNDIVAMLQLQAQKDLLGCSEDTSCLAELSGALGVDKVVVGQVGRLGQTFLVSLELVDKNHVAVDNRVSETFAGDESQLIYATRQAARRLLGVARRDPGGIAVSANQSGASVTLDAKDQGALPLPPLPGLVPGRHSLRVAKAGFVDWQSDVYVGPGATTPIWVELSAQPERWYQRWWVWTAAGVLVLGAATTSAYLLTHRSTPAATGTVALDGM